MRSAFRVILTVREKHACIQCDAIVQAPAPSRPIERGITEAACWAHARRKIHDVHVRTPSALTEEALNV
ncbi:transposase IS66 family protein [Grimontella sp. AG753]|nr:transposase IS66 family protein [Grimontella sp. AG753]